uniref:NAC-A/B domain-containing protein n=1 Tax=Gossypium raimondii TaxID=29730 RepID=A0A0D2RXX2_GOSRA|nr:hypothetical protein B456_006G061300 [Gossypium raimondii]
MSEQPEQPVVEDDDDNDDEDDDDDDKDKDDAEASSQASSVFVLNLIDFDLCLDSFLSFVIDIGATAMNQNPGTFKSRVLDGFRYLFIFVLCYMNWSVDVGNSICMTCLHDVDGTGRSKQSRSEKKSQKAMLKLGMKSIPGVSRVTIKKGKNILFVISNPDVFKSPASNTYIFKAPDLNHVISQPEPSTMAQDDEEVDETRVEPKDIELVMTQAAMSRSKAVKALKAADGDIVSAIMELTTQIRMKLTKSVSRA